MTKEEFLDTVAKFGLAHTEYNDFIEVKIKSRYGKPITLMEYCKKTVYSNYAWCCEQEGEVTIYFPQRVLSVDGYLVEIDQGDAMKNEQHKRFSKQTKLERTLTEVIYCPEDHRIGRAYGLYPDGVIDFEDEYTSTDKLEKFLMKKTKEIKDIKADLRMILMKEDFD